MVTIKTNSGNTLATLDANKEWAVLFPTYDKWRYLAFSASAKNLIGVGQ